MVLNKLLSASLHFRPTAAPKGVASFPTGAPCLRRTQPLQRSPSRVTVRVHLTTNDIDSAIEGPTCRMLALGMELPENSFVDLHNFDAVGETHGASHFVVSSDDADEPSSALHQIVRPLSDHTRPLEFLYSHSHPRTDEDELKTKNVWLKGHTGTSPNCISHP